MKNNLHELLQWLKPETIINTGGLFLISFVIFAETGLMIGFFLPGDSLLFSAGLLSSIVNTSTGHPYMDVNIWVLLTTVSSCAIIGNFTGYWIGRTFGPKLFAKEDSLIFKRKYLETTQAFYDRNGAMALIAGRFVPIVRTFVPVLAGAIKMDFKKFALLNIAGGIAWVFSMTLLGYFLGAKFPILREHLEKMVILLIIITLIPILRTFLKERKLAKNRENSN